MQQRHQSHTAKSAKICLTVYRKKGGIDRMGPGVSFHIGHLYTVESTVGAVDFRCNLVNASFDNLSRFFRISVVRSQNVLKPPLQCQIK